MDQITVFAPASIANLGAGYDVLGLALEHAGDVLSIKKLNTPELLLINQTPYHLPADPQKNIAGIAVNQLLSELGGEYGFEITFKKKIQPGSGLGSSGSSSAGAVFGVNKLLGSPFSTLKLAEFAMAGEAAVSGKGHADNVGASLYGGLILVRSYEPLDIIPINYPEEMWVSIVFPLIEVKTAEAKKMLKDYLPLKDAITQWGNLAGLVSGFQQKNFDLISRSLHDVVAEPKRSLLIPRYNEFKEIALNMDETIGFNISGSGPSMFAFSKTEKNAQEICRKGEELYHMAKIQTLTFTSKINHTGVKII